MENPGLKTLLIFLEQVQRNTPATFSSLSRERNRGYGMINRYIKFCRKNGLIRVISERRTRGRYPSKEYGLSERGETLLNIFKEGIH